MRRAGFKNVCYEQFIVFFGFYSLLLSCGSVFDEKRLTGYVFLLFVVNTPYVGTGRHRMMDTGKKLVLYVFGNGANMTNFLFWETGNMDIKADFMLISNSLMWVDVR
jgi:hypothetical protein